MKKIIIAITIVVSTLCLSSCVKDFDDLYKDPTQFSESTPEAALQGAFKRLNDFMLTNNTNRWWDVANSINASSRYYMEDGGLWQVCYVNVLEPIHQVKITYATDTNFTNRVQIARIWEAYTYSILVGNFGPVPLEQANNRDFLANNKYDSEETVYTYILNTLKEAAAKINLAKPQDRLVYDAIYGPNATSITNWKKFANTLRLKVALRIIKSLPDLAKQHIQDVMSNEANTITAETETCKMGYENLINNENPYYIKFKRQSYTLDPPLMMDIMFLYFRSYSDPRLDAYYDSVPDANRYALRDTLASTLDDSLRVVTYKIPHLGRPKQGATLSGWLPTLGNFNPMTDTRVTSFSRPKGYGWGTNNQAVDPGVGIFAPDRPVIILSYAESQFLKAEAAALALGGSKSAEQYYNEGIDANFAFWKVPNAQRDAYKAKNGVKWGTQGVGFTDYLSIIKADIPDDLTKIYVQSWINFYPDQAFDSWTLQRRTRAVAITPHTNPTNGLLAVPYIDIPLRGMYPTSALQINPAGYNDALSQLGVQLNDILPYIPLKWVKDYTVPDWNAKQAKYSSLFMQKWYGNTVQDLTAKGVAYTLIQTYKLP
jgi:hypothetical protein